MKVLDGQMSLFDFIETDNEFVPLEALALRGTGFVNGMTRVADYFREEHSISEKAKFLKKEYGLGGFSTPTREPCMIRSMNTYGHGKKDVAFAYYDKDMNEIETYCSWDELARTISTMVKRGTYKNEEQ